MPLSLSQRAARTVQSEIRAMSIACEKVQGINLAQGVCDTEVPLPVREGAKQAMDQGINSYTRAEGLAPIRQAIAEKMQRFNGVACDPETEVVVNSGATGAFYAACLALLNPGDEVILFEPYYGYHLNTLVAAEAVPLYVTLRAPDWTFNREDLERTVTLRTRAIVLNSPANPSGKVFTREELEWIAGFAKRHDLFVFTDEIYEYFVFEGQHISMATLPGMRERTITMSGYSKTFSITGWRIGYTVCDRRWAQGIAYFHDLIYVCAPAPLQIGVAEGIRQLPESFYAEIGKEYVLEARHAVRRPQRDRTDAFGPQGRILRAGRCLDSSGQNQPRQSHVSAPADGRGDGGGLGFLSWRWRREPDPLLLCQDRCGVGRGVPEIERLAGEERTASNGIADVRSSAFPTILKKDDISVRYDCDILMATE